MFDIDELLSVAFPKYGDEKAWLEGAVDATEYLVRNSRSSEIILYTAIGQTYFHSVLAPLNKVTPANGDDLLGSWVHADGAWAIEHSSGGGEPDRMYLSDPLDSPGCKSLIGGEQLVFRRSFRGVKGEPIRTELSQRLVQALDLYWRDEESAYCRLNEDGDIEPIIRTLDMSQFTGDADDILVTIDAHQLHRYMAVTEMALAMKFDFTRYRSGAFMGWHTPERGHHADGELFYNSGVQPDSSFASGVLIVRPLLTKEQMIEHSQRRWTDKGKQYATFKAQDWKNNALAEISCAPSALASYFEKDSPLPFQVTPAFFKADVLLKYKADPEKYTLEHRSIQSRAGWYLKTYDVNEAGQVHTYLCYLADLPYSEQLYWQSFNEWPKASISKRAFETDFEGSFSTQPDPLLDLQYEIKKLDKAKPDWWLPRGEALIDAVHYPLTASPEEWANSILALDQMVIEGFAVKPLRNKLAGREVDKQWGSIRLVQECLAAAGVDEDDLPQVMESLRQLHHLRSKVKGHATGDKLALIKEARTKHGSLAAHFRSLVERVQESFDRVIEIL